MRSGAATTVTLAVCLEYICLPHATLSAACHCDHFLCHTYHNCSHQNDGNMHQPTHTDQTHNSFWAGLTLRPSAPLVPPVLRYTSDSKPPHPGHGANLIRATVQPQKTHGGRRNHGRNWLEPLQSLEGLKTALDTPKMAEHSTVMYCVHSSQPPKYDQGSGSPWSYS